MKKSTFWVIAGVAGVGIVGYYLYNRYAGKKATATPAPLPTPTPAPAPSGYEDYVVTTQRSNLNIRQNPDSVAKIVGSLSKGSEIKAKPSSVAGWLEVSKDGVTSLGFSSEAFLRKK